MLKKIKSIIRENLNLHQVNSQQLRELEWAHIYHDSIRGKEWLENLPLNIGRWAGNYSFFYVLNRVLSDYKPKEILEFGLGESSKFISTFLEFELLDSNQQVIEQSLEWSDSFKGKFKLSLRTKVDICPIYLKNILNNEVNAYKGLNDIVNKNYDLYIVDGPFGSLHFSRYDIVELAQNFKVNDEFIIIIDDYNRLGEKETAEKLIALLKQKGISIYTGEYSGNKIVFVIGTEKYKNVQSL